MNENVLLDKQQATAEEEEETSPELNLYKVYDFALTAPLDEIRFILDTPASIKRQPNKLLKATTDTPSERCCVELMNIKSWVTVFSPIFFLILRLLVMHVWQVQ